MTSDAPTGWNSDTVESLMSAIIDYRGKSPRKAVAGVPLVTAKIIKGGRILEPTEFIATEDYDTWMRRGLPRVGDVLITTEAPMGQVAQLARADVALAQRVILLRADSKRMSGTFLRFLLQSRCVQNQLRARSTGTTVTGIKQRELRRVLLRFPSMDEQRRIAAVLGALDNKIELNRKMSRTLEEMTEATFKSWFVDFDGHDDLVDSELGPIPRGWEVHPLARLATLITDTVKPMKLPAREWEHFSIPAFDDGALATRDVGAAIKSNKYGVPEHSVLVSKLNPRFPRVWLPDPDEWGDAICSTEFMPFVPIESEQRPFLFDLMRSKPMEQAIQARVTGTTGSRQRAKPKEIAVVPVTLPPARRIDEYSDLARPMHERRLAALRESRTLAALRDILLPKLISGEIRVPEALDIVESAS